MALSEDQRALLQLLLAGDTYEQVAEVLGTTPAEVRERAERAAATLESDPRPDLPSEAVRDRLSALESGEPSRPPSAPRAVTADRSTAWRRWALWGALGAAALIVLVVVLVAGGGGGEDNSPTTTAGDQEDVVPIQLNAVGRSGARGMISVVRVADQPAVDLAITGLKPSGSGQSYVLWFVGSGGRSLPIAFHAVGSDGRLVGRTPIPSAAEGLLPSFDTAILTLARQREAAAAVRRAAQSSTLPQVVGAPVMRGALR